MRQHGTSNYSATMQLTHTFVEHHYRSDVAIMTVTLICCMRGGGLMVVYKCNYLVMCAYVKDIHWHPADGTHEVDMFL